MSYSAFLVVHKPTSPSGGAFSFVDLGEQDNIDGWVGEEASAVVDPVKIADAVDPATKKAAVSRSAISIVNTRSSLSGREEHVSEV